MLVISAAFLLLSPSIREAVAISGVGRGGRIPFAQDAVTAQIARGTFTSPVEGTAIKLPTGAERKWSTLKAGDDGWFQGPAFNGGYVFARHNSPTARTVLLSASGHSLVYVNRVLRTGDPYQYGYVKLPIELKAGENTFLFSCGRGRLKVDLEDAPAEVFLNGGDLTLPDFYPGDKGSLWGAVPIVNTLNADLADYALRVELDGKKLETKGAAILALGTRKVAFQIPSVKSELDELPLDLSLIRNGKVVHHLNFKVRNRKLGQTYKRTFFSNVDGSLQYFAVVPQTNPTPKSGLVLSLHGASVEATSQADAYRSKDWCTIVAATNRRPFGFDWEEIGRLDAIEVLQNASALFNPDPSRVYLTGHSMGGHGTWQVGVQYPDLFAGIAPSAGWISFFSYGGGVKTSEPTPMHEVIQRAASPSDTLTLSRNYLSYPIYILHGDADDNVPVTEARTMRDHLKPFHPNVTYHEQPKAGHWWGNECVDWPGIFEMFKANPRPEQKEFDFSTNSLSVNNKYAWVSINQQIKLMATSRVRLAADQEGKTIRGTTENVEALTLDLKTALPGIASRKVELDGQTIDVGKAPGAFFFRNREGMWSYATQIEERGKWGAYAGPFKNIFNQRVVFVYGTKGSAEENLWMKSKARFDAETLWYRGNGAVDVVSDVEFAKGKFKGRNTLLFGNSETNGAWLKLLATCPIKVGRAGILVGTKAYSGDRATCFIYPSSQERTLVGAVGGTTLNGLRLTDRLPYFTSGVQFPDFSVFDAEVFDEGSAKVLDAGYFDNNWRIGERVSN